MSVGSLSRHRSTSRSSNHSSNVYAPAPSITPSNDLPEFEPCAATASFLLYAQRNVILCLHHDTLAIERQFTRHKEDVVWISVDNVSERASGRLVVSCDVSQTTIVWDLFNGDEVARFASYEEIKVAAWMRNGNIAFGNSQGNVILFEPSTSEHISARTIFDPITALAPAADCRTFAIGYMNGSILIASLQPSFTILHTLNTSRAPSMIRVLAWHGSSSKQKSDMLGSLTADGDLRVWSVPKGPHSESPTVIRILNRSDFGHPGPCWFGWSKMGRIVQYIEGQALSWDVRTKRVTYEPVPTIDGVTAIANYGPTATLFTLGRNHTVQQYDLNPAHIPTLVANVQHVPANAPPSPPNSIEEQKAAAAAHGHSGNRHAAQIDISSSEGGEGTALSPLQKIAQEMDQMEEERRDRVGPLSPVSSKGSMSSMSSGGRRSTEGRKPSRSKPVKQAQLPYRPSKSPAVGSTASGGESTVFSMGSSVRTGHESVSIRSLSSATSSRYNPSSLRQQLLRSRSPEETRKQASMDLFPFVKARLSDVPFRTPQYSPGQRTPDDLRRQMLSVVFGWDDDIEALIRDELSRHPSGSPSGVLLSKWLGEVGADMMASMVGTETMTSSDWMLLALSSMGQDSQKKVGEAFVQRLLEKGDIHPAAAILLGLGEHNDAIEVYVSRRYYMEAVLLTCLIFPTDWQRQSYLVRKWGEVAVAHKQAELAVRCFSCTSIESSEPWYSPRSQDAVYAAQQQILGAQPTPPLSPPSSRFTNLNSGLRLTTNFNQNRHPEPDTAIEDATPIQGVGVTPIADTAVTPGAAASWLRPSARNHGATPASARTATPGAYRRRTPSRQARELETPMEETPVAHPVRERNPQTAIDISRRAEQEQAALKRRSASMGGQSAPNLLDPSAYRPSSRTSTANKSDRSLPSPRPDIIAALQDRSPSRNRNGSRSRKPDTLQLHLQENVVEAPSSAYTTTSAGSRQVGASPVMTTDGSMKSSKIRSIDNYISSLEEANYYSRHQRVPSRQSERSTATAGRLRESSEGRGRAGTRYIKPAKRSPSSPVPMSPDDVALYHSDRARESENAKDVISPGAASIGANSTGRGRNRSQAAENRSRAGSKNSRRAQSPDRAPQGRSRQGSRAASRAASRQASPARLSVVVERGRSQDKSASITRSPSSPLPMSAQARLYRDDDDDNASDKMSVGARVRSRQRSTSRRPSGAMRRDASPDRHDRERSRSRRAIAREPIHEDERNVSPPRLSGRQSSRSRLPKLQTDLPGSRPMTKKELAAKELEERRLSLARRPSAPVILHPEELRSASAIPSGRPTPARSATDPPDPSSAGPWNTNEMAFPERQTVGPPQSDRGSFRAHTVIPEQARHSYSKSTPVGLPATPRAMRHPKYMTSATDSDVIPAVPEIPSDLAMTAPPREPIEQIADDDVAPLLPATVFSQKFSQPPPRAASAPIEKNNGSNNGYSGTTLPSTAYKPQNLQRKDSLKQGQWRRISPKEPMVPSAPPAQVSPKSIDQTIHDGESVFVVDVPEYNGAPNQSAVLPELQHLAGPPVPPPPPPMFPHSRKGSLGVINIAIDENPSTSNSPVMTNRPNPAASPVENIPLPSSTTASPSTHRRGRGSVSENIGSRFRSVTERMRSTSRSRNKSPPTDGLNPSPYESILPPMPFNRTNSESNIHNATKSPSQDIGSTPYEELPAGYPSPAHLPAPAAVSPPTTSTAEAERSRQQGPPQDQPKLNNGFQGYRNPKEIRANMPPEQLQQGVYHQGMWQPGMI